MPRLLPGLFLSGEWLSLQIAALIPPIVNDFFKAGDAPLQLRQRLVRALCPNVRDGLFLLRQFDPREINLGVQLIVSAFRFGVWHHCPLLPCNDFLRAGSADRNIAAPGIVYSS